LDRRGFTAGAVRADRGTCHTDHNLRSGGYGSGGWLASARHECCRRLCGRKKLDGTPPRKGWTSCPRWRRWRY